MYKLLLVSDKEEIRSLYRHYAEWNTLGFEQPAIAENAQQGIDLLSHHRYDAISSLLSVSEGKKFFAYLARRPDMLGMELGGSLKNVIALAAGIADGKGYGDNTKAALITRGIAEIARLGVKMGGAVETFSGLTGIGDLIVTCASVHSRNRKAGYLMGQGKSMQEAMDEVQMVVEGVYSAKAAVKLGEKYGVSLPIINKVSEVLFDGKDPKEAVNELMLRDNKAEHTALPWEK